MTGGFSLAAQWVWGDELEIVAFCEIDKFCHYILRKHWPNVEIIKDIRDADGNEFKEIDIITFGFPCQDISVAGKRAGLHAKRSGLFFEAMQIIEVTKPKVFIFENVKGLLSSNGGRDFATILRTIADIGLYDCEWQLLNTRWFLPQNRERIYFIGHLRGTSKPKVFPITEGDKVFNEKERRKFKGKARILSTIDSRYGALRNAGESYILDGYNQNFTDGFGSIRQNMNNGGSLVFLGGVMGDKNQMWLEDGKENSRNFPQGQRVYSPEGDSCQLTAQGGGWGAKTGLYMVQRSRGFNKGGAKELPNLTDHNYHQNNFLNGIRRLTPLECERLQGFPDRWTEGLSDTQRYKCLGNAISVPIAEIIFKAIKEIDNQGKDF